MNSFVVGSRVWYAGPPPRSTRRFLEEYHGLAGTVELIQGHRVCVKLDNGIILRSHFTDFEPIWEYKEC